MRLAAEQHLVANLVPNTACQKPTLHISDANACSVQMADAKEASSGSDLELDVESDDDVPLAKKKQKGSR